jgi:hypothetical protein
MEELLHLLTDRPEKPQIRLLVSGCTTAMSRNCKNGLPWPLPKPTKPEPRASGGGALQEPNRTNPGQTVERGSKQ